MKKTFPYFAALLSLTLLSSSAPQAATPPKIATLSVALDWVPNVNHIGIYVAQAQGWYSRRGIKLNFALRFGFARRAGGDPTRRCGRLERRKHHRSGGERRTHREHCYRL